MKIELKHMAIKMSLWRSFQKTVKLQCLSVVACHNLQLFTRISPGVVGHLGNVPQNERNTPNNKIEMKPLTTLCNGQYCFRWSVNNAFTPNINTYTCKNNTVCQKSVFALRATFRPVPSEEPHTLSKRLLNQVIQATLPQSNCKLPSRYIIHHAQWKNP